MEYSTGAYPPTSTQEYSTGESLRRRFTNTNDEEWFWRELSLWISQLSAVLSRNKKP